MRAFLKALQDDYPTVQSRLADLHKRTADEAQQVIIEAYQSSKVIDKGHPYRFAESSQKLRRYSNGLMLKALSDKNLNSSSAEGIQFVNVSILDSQAKQWRRLNFGAGDRGNSSPKRTPTKMNFFGQQSRVSLDFANQKPSPGFYMPESLSAFGFFANQLSGTNSGVFSPVPLVAGAGQAFYIVTSRTVTEDGVHPGTRFSGMGKISRSKKIANARFFARHHATQGIRAAGFLEEGAEYINRTYPERLTELITDWFTGSVKAGDNLPAKPGNNAAENYGKIVDVTRSRAALYKKLYRAVREDIKHGRNPAKNLRKFNALRKSLGMKPYVPKGGW
jgi:hypothetical protein